MDKRRNGRLGNRNRFISEVGKTYGTLTVIKEVEKKGTLAAFICRCNCGCGGTKIMTGASLRGGRDVSCRTRKLTKEEIYRRTHGLRKCHTCKELHPAREFPYLTKHECKTCRGRNKFILLRKYGITEDDYYEMLKLQNGGCAICGDPPPGGGRWKNYLHIDHEHSDGQCTKEMVRGLLCSHCNNGIGRFRDDIPTIRRAISYLEAWKQKNS